MFIKTIKYYTLLNHNTKKYSSVKIIITIIIKLNKIEPVPKNLKIIIKKL